jgi:WD40 repeat protein
MRGGPMKSNGAFTMLILVAVLWNGHVVKADTLFVPKKIFGNSSIYSVTVSPDGTKLLVSMNGWAYLMDASAGAILRTFMQPGSDIRAIALSPDGSKVLSGSSVSTNGAILWDASTGSKIKSFGKVSRAVLSVAFSTDGSNIFVATFDSLMIWDSSGNVKRAFSILTNNWSPRSISISADGSKALVGYSDSNVVLWDTSGIIRRTFPGHSSAVYSVAFSPDGSKVVSGSEDKTAILWDTSGALIKTFAHSAPVYAVAFSPDGGRVLTCPSGLSPILWDASSGGIIKTFNENPGRVSSVAFFSDGLKIVSGCANAVKLWDVSTGGVIKTFFGKGHKDFLRSVSFSPDGSKVLTGSDDSTAILWDTSGTAIRTFTNKNRVTSVAFFPDGSKVLTGSQDSTAILWDTSGSVITTFRHTDQITCAAVSADGLKICTGTFYSKVNVWNASTGDIITTFSFPSYTQVTSVAFQQNKILAGGGSSVKLWDIPTGNCLSSLSIGGRVLSADIKGTLVLIGSVSSSGSVSSGTETVELWDSNSGSFLKCILQLQSFGGSGPYAVFSPDGTKLAATFVGECPDNIWRVDGGLLKTLAFSFSGSSSTIAFSPDGTKVLTGCIDGTAKLWVVSNNPTAITGKDKNSPAGNCRVVRRKGKLVICNQSVNLIPRPGLVIFNAQGKIIERFKPTTTALSKKWEFLIPGGLSDGVYVYGFENWGKFLKAGVFNVVK